MGLGHPCSELTVVNSLSEQKTTEKPGFDRLELRPLTLQALDKVGYEHPTPVQAGLIPMARAGSDVLAQARTGTGKTAAFVIPILEMLDDLERSRNPSALVLVPTRELAVQVHDEVVKLSYGRTTKCVAVYGGKPIRGQILDLRRGANVVVGTPGRVLDHIARSTLVLGDLRIVVLDEADRMLDIGFRPDIEKILRKCPRSRQTLLLSATVPGPIERLAQRYMQDPEKLDCSPTEIAVETIQQYYFTVEQEKKVDLLLHLLLREKPQQAIVFCRTKRGTERVFRRLRERCGEVIGCIHGDMAQTARDRAMQRFRNKKIRLLVATDVVGRGIDVSGISHIVNFDIPQSCDDYVHRVGRTGRMGREGTAFTFATPEEGPELTRIEVRIDRLLIRDSMPGFEATLQPTNGDAIASDSQDQDGETSENTPPAPMNSRHGRGPKRYKRGL